MPRLFDLLSDDTRKELLSEQKKKKHELRSRNAGRRSEKKRSPGKSVQEKKGTITIPDFVAIDVETTGLDFKNDRIIEIGAVLFRNGTPSEEYSTLVNPGKKVPEQISELTGIQDTDVEEAPLFEEIAQQFIDFIGDRPICGHQIEFDVSFLKGELKRIAKPVPENTLIDTALLSRIVLHYRERFSLKHVCNLLDVILDNAHRALHDARASGEIALKLIPKITELPFTVRQTIAACAPASLFKQFVFQSLSGSRSMVTIEFSKEKPFQRLPSPEELKDIKDTEVTEIMNSGVAALIEGYSPRKQQLRMAKGVVDAFNTHSFYIAEAGTGTGKSFAYLIPSALWALQNNNRIVIATRTKNLQDQLIEKDIPIVCSATGNRLKSTVLKGRSNYLCQNRFRLLLLGKNGNMSPRERLAILPLIVWSAQTKTGDIEEQNLFNPKWFAKIWNIISAEHHECGHRKCHFYSTCFFQRARNKALGAHIVVINHALFFSDICADNSFLGINGPMIFDEAHHLEAGGHRFLRVEIDTHRMNFYSEIIHNLIGKAEALKEEKEIYECGRAIRRSLKQLRKTFTAFSSAIGTWAQHVYPGNPEYQKAYTDSFFNEISETGTLLQSISDIYDRISALRQTIKGHSNRTSFESFELDTQACLERTSQFRADFSYLTSARTEEHVFWVEGNYTKGWTKLCGVPLDIGSLLSGIWERCSHAVVFTSATLSIDQSVDYFKSHIGVDHHENRTVSELFKSPFSSHQSTGCIMRSGPEPDAPNYPMYVADTVAALHNRFGKNILILFTAHSMLSSVYQALKIHPSISKSQLLAQGISGTRQLVLDEFKKGNGMILLGAESFWEGVDVSGEACEMVIISRLPFPVPTHPLTAAIAERMETVHGESFFSYAVPEAVIRFRQGAGRLIRTSSDRGALIVLDNRIVTRGYGKKFVRSVDTPFSSFDDSTTMGDHLHTFFTSDFEESTEEAEVTYVPLEDV